MDHSLSELEPTNREVLEALRENTAMQHKVLKGLESFGVIVETNEAIIQTKKQFKKRVKKTNLLFEKYNKRAKGEL